MKKRSVLFICSKNSCRSQMAEAFLRAISPNDFDAFSAGLESTRVDPLAVKVMNEIGIDMSEQESKKLDRFLSERFSYLITVCDRANRSCPVFPGVSIREHWSFDDPAAVEGSEEERLIVYRRIRDEIKNRIEQFLSDETDH
ncbi:MAG TPA: arsenate reductase ArsC [Thermotogota bacterium]|nr:arsenate reductase ArsC [Thermotogota bacterium]HPJ89330.1 arsenate reductase ArsC [Thermotogota bacterium]HPR97145.1 arsenate reductase ArsC [Thermotogota bacterium]